MMERPLGSGARLVWAAGLPLLLAVASPSHVAAQAGTKPEVTDLRTEYKENPLGIDTPRPRLSWRLRSDRRGVVQSAYEIRVARTARGLRSRGGRLWESGKVVSDESTHRPYEGPPLESRQRYFWQVRVWDEADRSSGWSAPAWWEMGLLAPVDWTASWIEPDWTDDPSVSGPVPMLRREFELDGEIQKARAYVTAHGLYEMHLNGRRVGDQLFTPGWTAYAERLQYQTYDVTSLLRRGRNAVGALLGNGWYRGDLAGWIGRRAVYGDHLALLAQIEITYEGGRREIVGTDGDWKATTGPIRMSEIYHGETYDARLERPGWTAAGFDDHDWSGVRVVDSRKDVLVAPAGPPVRRIEELKPVKILRTPEGDTVVDMGQNMVGWVRLSVEGPAGTTVTLRHSEVLDKEGNFYTESLRRAKQTIRYTLKGGGLEDYEPHFTFQGFRYVAVEGYPGELTPDRLTGIVIHSDIAPSGALETSKPLVNQLQHNIRWGQKGNFLDVPTDCPQRDERLGWTGDAEVFYRTAAFNFDVAGFFTKWLRDLAADQYDNGAVPHVIPDVLTSPDRVEAGSAGWADAAVIIPWGMYLTYGDRRLLEQQFDSMAGWVEYMRGRAGDDSVWDGDRHFGDWLAYAAPPGEARSYPGASTGKDLIATAFFAHSTDLLRRIALVLGRSDDAAHYGELLAKIKTAFTEEFVSPRGRVGENTQTAYVLALRFGLLPEDLRPVAAKRLARDVCERGHLTTGFLGTPHLCHVLSDFGYLDEAYMLLNREEYPSWLYPVTQGATTIWERWDGQKPDGTFQDPSMNSFNHYAYGAVGDWMYRVMAGIDTDEAAPGYKHILIRPRPGGGFTWVKAHHATLYGRVGSAWTLEGGRFELEVEVPPNATATVRLPGARLADVTESTRPLAAENGISAPRQDGDAVVVEVGSGRYSFAYPLGVTTKETSP
jgi:alpha-L-rhamnosidase